MLIKSILFSIQVYWASLFILPSSIHKTIENMLRTFFWLGPLKVKVKAKSTWEDYCIFQLERGLGIMRTLEWNKVVMMRHLWNITSSKHDSIWVKQDDRHYLKNKYIWHVHTSQSCSQTQKRILKLRNKVKSCIDYRVSDGERINLWYDKWHSLGAFINKFGDRIIYDSNQGKMAKVEAIIRDRNCCWPSANSQSLMEIKKGKNISPKGDKDEVRWNSISSSEFSTLSNWNIIRTRLQKMPQTCLLWFTCHTSEHSTILWMVMKGRMYTKDKLMKIGISNNQVCFL